MLAKRILAWLLIASLQVSGFGPAFAATAPDQAKTGIFTGPSSYTWTTLPSASAVSARTQAWATNLGENGTLLESNGTRWGVLTGTATLQTLGAAVSGIGAAEQIVLQTLLPAGSWQTNDSIWVWLTFTKSGATDSGLVTVRVGTAGTTADTAITGLSALATMTAAARSGGAWYEIKLLSATSAQKLGAASTTTASYQSPGASTVVSAATAITDASANALWVSLSFYSSGATDTVAVTSARIQLTTP